MVHICRLCLKLFLFIIQVTLLTGAVPPLHLCKQINDCICKYLDDGTILDLTSLGNKDGTPRFKDIPSPDGLLYSYNPCGGFSEGVCNNATVCLKSTSGETRMIGSAALTSQFTYDEITTETVIGYTAGEIGQTHTFVYLICDTNENPGSPQLFPNGTQDQDYYIMTVKSVCACGGGCDANGPIHKSKPSSGVETFLYICIGVAGLIVLYFLVGSLIMKFALKKRGREIIPNSAFWCNLPTNIKNCSTWCFEKCVKGEDYKNMK